MKYDTANRLAKMLAKSTTRRSVLKGIVGSAVTGVATLAAVGCCSGDDKRDDRVDDSSPEADVALTADSLEALTALVLNALADGNSTHNVQQSLPPVYGPVFVALGVGGERVGSGWASATSIADAVTQAVQEADGRRNSQSRPTADTVEVCLTHRYRPVHVDREGKVSVSSVHRGVLGLELQFGQESARYSPTLMTALNWGFDRAAEEFIEEHNVTADDLVRGAVRAQVFESKQALVELAESPRAR